MKFAYILPIRVSPAPSLLGQDDLHFIDYCSVNTRCYWLRLVPYGRVNSTVITLLSDEKQETDKCGLIWFVNHEKNKDGREFALLFKELTDNLIKFC